MNPQDNSIAVVYRGQTPGATQLARRLEQWLAQRQASARLMESLPGQELSLEPGTSLVVVLGGDGTMLAAVRAVVAAGLRRAPVLGVNLGGLGFLTALGQEELLPAMERVLKGEYQAPPRMMLAARVERDGEMLTRFTALNDVVISKHAVAGLTDFVTSLEKTPLTTFRADGLVVSTPTGSTAYNLSAGGPICHPDLDCLVVTPLCPFALSNRPLVLAPYRTLTVTPKGERTKNSLTCDGQAGMPLLPGDRVLISRAPETVRIVNSPFRDYFEILRTKLRWG